MVQTDRSRENRGEERRKKKKEEKEGGGGWREAGPVVAVGAAGWSLSKPVIGRGEEKKEGFFVSFI